MFEPHQLPCLFIVLGIKKLLYSAVNGGIPKQIWVMQRFFKSVLYIGSPMQNIPQTTRACQRAS